MKKHLQRLSALRGSRGDAVILTIMALLVLFIFTASMLFLFSSWQKTAFKTLSGRAAYRFAKTGMEEAIWEIDRDCMEEDSFLDGWRANFQGVDADLNEDGIPDSRWFNIKNREGEIMGRYAVAVEDESGKININCAGSLENLTTHTVSDIAVLCSLIGKAGARNIMEYRKRRKYTAPSDVKLAENIGGKTYEKIKNYITCFSYDLNINRRGEYRVPLNGSSFEDIWGVLTKLDYGEEKAARIALNIMAYRAKDSAPPVKSVNGRDIIGIGKTPYINEIDAVKPWKKSTLSSGTIVLSEQGGQFVELFNPYEKELDIGGWEIQGAVTLFPESREDIVGDSGAILNDALRGETEISSERTSGLLDKIVSTSIVIPKGAKIPPRSYYTIGDSIAIKILIVPSKPPAVIPLFMPIKDPAGCNHYQPILAVNPGSLGFISELLSCIPLFANMGLDFTIKLYDREKNIIEDTTYFADLPHMTVQKNDPRMAGVFDWFLGKETAGKRNKSFHPWVGGEFGKTGWILNWPSGFNIKNSGFSSLSELSFIHKQQQWKTLDFWQYGSDRKIIDRFTAVNDPKEPTFGRININTASETVLACLPFVDGKLAKTIAGARPYKDISEILGAYGERKTPEGELSREMTKYGFDLKDNDKDGYIDAEKEKELIFLRIIDLITVRSNVFKIITLGQKVRNIENNGKIVEEILAEKKLAAWYDRREKRVIYKREIQ